MVPPSSCKGWHADLSIVADRLASRNDDSSRINLAACVTCLWLVVATFSGPLVQMEATLEDNPAQCINLERWGLGGPWLGLFG